MLNKISKQVFIGMGLSVILALSGCSLFRPSNTLEMKVASVNYLNPDVNGMAAPVVVTLYQLKSKYAFKQSSFDSLSNNAASVLGDNLIDKQVIEIQPGQSKQFPLKLSTNTQYIGVVAAYRNIDKANWQSLVDVSNHHSGAEILLSLESQGLMSKVVS